MEKKAIYQLQANEEIKIKNNVVYVVKKFDKFQWAKEIRKNYKDKYMYNYDLQIGYVAVRSLDYKKFGIAWCHPNDTWNLTLGLAVAICKAESIPLPDEL